MGKIIIKEAKHPRSNGKKMSWLVIECSHDPNPEGRWEKLMPADIPDWVKNEENISKMMEGKMVCWNPEEGCRWYRAYEVKRPRVN